MSKKKFERRESGLKRQIQRVMLRTVSEQKIKRKKWTEEEKKIEERSLALHQDTHGQFGKSTDNCVWREINI